MAASRWSLNIMSEVPKVITIVSNLPPAQLIVHLRLPKAGYRSAQKYTLQAELTVSAACLLLLRRYILRTSQEEPHRKIL